MRLRMEGYTLGEILLEDHDSQLTALYRACSRLHLDVEHSRGPRITEPVVVTHEDDWSYLVPRRWDPADALQRLPAAFAAARPAIARELERLDEAKHTAQGTMDQAIDLMTSLILQTGNVQGVYDDLVRLLDRADLPAGQTGFCDSLRGSVRWASSSECQWCSLGDLVVGTDGWCSPVADTGDERPGHSHADCYSGCGVCAGQRWWALGA
ncbi:hypothetical protein GTY23_11860 [Streptomyces sp. SID5998]|nr:hypothetical protein [Streptomyces sp. SID5998]